MKKFASEGENVVFTGRNTERVKSAESNYKAEFPEVKIIGKTLNALKEDGSVDENGVVSLFESLDRAGITVSDLV